MKRSPGSLERLARAVEIAVTAHKNATDRNGAPYIPRPLRVMHSVDGVQAKILAILHDVIEDTEWSLKDLREEGFPAKIIHAVDCLTRQGEDYEEFVHRSASTELSKTVKLADLRDNMDIRRMPELTPENVVRLAKYRKAWKQITGE